MAGEWLGLLAGLLAAQDSAPMLFACGATSKGYVVGAPLPPSGLFLFSSGSAWKHPGFNHPNIVAADFDPRRPDVLYLAAGNGCIRAASRAEQWRILTDWRMTEIQDVSLDYAQPGSIYIALPDGIGFSPDEGRTWMHRDDGIRRKFVQSLQVDRTRPGRLLAGAEQGIFLSADRGLHWSLAGAQGLMITHLEQSRRDPSRWMATAQSGGLLASRDKGQHWVPARSFRGRTLYNVSLDPQDANRAAICGWDAGVWVTEDFGATWLDRGAGLPSRRVWRVSFDPSHPRRLWASVHEEAVFVSEDLGVTWRRSGLEGSIVRDFVFVPEAPQ